MNQRIKEQIELSANRLNCNYKRQGIFEGGPSAKMPDRLKIIEILHDIRRVMFPGYFGTENPAYVSLHSFAGSRLAKIFEALHEQIRTALLYQGLEDTSEEVTLKFIEKLPEIQRVVLTDVDAAYEGDPAAGSKEEIIFSYPGLYATFVYRIAHELYNLNVPFIPRIMSEHAHSKAGIDINPGAQIGEYFFIDHGTGIVIGETTVIGNHVKLYQGVTLGALSTMKGQGLSGVKRHPTIEDHVVIYSNASILGGDTVIGKNSVVAGNTFVTQSIPEDSKVSTYEPRLQLRKRNLKK